MMSSMTAPELATEHLKRMAMRSPTFGLPPPEPVLTTVYLSPVAVVAVLGIGGGGGGGGGAGATSSSAAAMPALAIRPRAAAVPPTKTSRLPRALTAAAVDAAGPRAGRLRACTAAKRGKSIVVGMISTLGEWRLSRNGCARTARAGNVLPGRRLSVERKVSANKWRER